MGLGDPAQQAGGDHGTGQDPVAGESGQLGGLLTQERADLIARQLTPAAGSVLVRDRRRATIRIGIVGDHQVRIDLTGLVQRQVQRPGLLRVGEGHRREVRIRLELLGHLDDVGEPGSREHLTAGGPTHAVHRRQHDLHRGGGRHPSRLSGPLDVLLPDLRVDRLPARLRAGYGADRADGVDRRSDLAVIGGNDLGPLTRVGHGPPAQVDLVAVVLRRVVRGRHHDAGVGLQAPQREGEYRGRAVRLEENGPPARTGDDRGRIEGELLGVVAGVVADDDAEALTETVLEVSGQPRRGADDDDPVHPVGAPAQTTSQAGRAEGEGAAEGVAECPASRLGLLAMRTRGAQQFSEFGAGDGVRIVLDPRVHGNVVVHIFRASGHICDGTAR